MPSMAFSSRTQEVQLGINSLLRLVLPLENPSGNWAQVRWTEMCGTESTAEKSGLGGLGVSPGLAAVEPVTPNTGSE